MSVSYVVDFTALLLLGPEQTVFVAAASAVAQSTLNVRKGNPFYRTLFNIAAIVLTIEFAGLVFGWSGGGARQPRMAADCDPAAGGGNGVLPREHDVGVGRRGADLGPEAASGLE